MPKWEYTVLVTDKPLVQELNNFGKEGWEVILLKEIPEDDRFWRVFFKRPLSE